MDRVDYGLVRAFLQPLCNAHSIRTGRWKANGLMKLDECLEVESRAMPAARVDEWLPKVHTANANIKHILSCLLEEVSSPKLQKYLDEIVYR